MEVKEVVSNKKLWRRQHATLIHSFHKQPNHNHYLQKASVIKERLIAYFLLVLKKRRWSFCVVFFFWSSARFSTPTSKSPSKIFVRFPVAVPLWHCLSFLFRLLSKADQHHCTTPLRENIAIWQHPTGKGQRRINVLQPSLIELPETVFSNRDRCQWILLSVHVIKEKRAKDQVFEPFTQIQTRIHDRLIVLMKT